MRRMMAERFRMAALACAITLMAFFASACTAHSSASGSDHTPVTTNSAESPGANLVSNLPNPFTVTRRFSAASLGLKQLLSLAIGPDGNFYVTDTTPSVAVISPRGKVLRRWGGPATAPASSTCPLIFKETSTPRSPWA